jgi:hypothetical protein
VCGNAVILPVILRFVSVIGAGYFLLSRQQYA